MLVSNVGAWKSSLSSESDLLWRRLLLKKITSKEDPLSSPLSCVTLSQNYLPMTISQNDNKLLT